jgi:RNA polymerase sigma-70 factor (ECF subfamily)
MSKGQSDFDLVQGLVQRGDEACFLELFNRHSPRVYRVAYRILNNQADAEDIVQEVFIKVLTKVGEFKFQCKFTSWIHRVAANVALMRLRSVKRRPSTSMEDLSGTDFNSLVAHRSDSTNIDYMTCQHEIRAILQEAIDSLPIAYREIFCLRDIDGLSNKEASNLLHLTETSVKNRILRARYLVREKVEEYLKECELAA